MPVSPVPVPHEAFAWFQVAVDALRPDDDVDASLPDPPAPLLLARGTSPALVEAVEARPARIVVAGRAAPGRPALEEARARLEQARAVAAERDGVVLDVVVPRAVAAGAPAGPAVSSWFGFEHVGSPEGGDDGPQEVLTHGLVRFGLPELWCATPTAASLPMHDAVLVGVAQRLLEEWPERDPVGPATVTLRDVARGYADASAGGDDPTLQRGIDLTLSYDVEAEHLAVVLHDDPATALFA